MARFLDDKFPAPCPASIKKFNKSCSRNLDARFLDDKFPAPWRASIQIPISNVLGILMARFLDDRLGLPVVYATNVVSCPLSQESEG